MFGFLEPFSSVHYSLLLLLLLLFFCFLSSSADICVVPYLFVLFLSMKWPDSYHRHFTSNPLAIFNGLKASFSLLKLSLYHFLFVLAMCNTIFLQIHFEVERLLQNVAFEPRELKRVLFSALASIHIQFFPKNHFYHFPAPCFTIYTIVDFTQLWYAFTAFSPQFLEP